MSFVVMVLESFRFRGGDTSCTRIVQATTALLNDHPWSTGTPSDTLRETMVLPNDQPLVRWLSFAFKHCLGSTLWSNGETLLVVAQGGGIVQTQYTKLCSLYLSGNAMRHLVQHLLLLSRRRVVPVLCPIPFSFPERLLSHGTQI